MKRMKELWRVAVIVCTAALIFTAGDNETTMRTSQQQLPPVFMETVEVQGGSFMFGRNGAKKGENDKLVTVSTFRIGKYPVTQGQWKAVMGENPSAFDGTNAYDYNKDKYVSAKKTFNRDKLPVETVCWYEVLIFANKLSMKENLQPAYKIKGESDPAKWGGVPTLSNDDWNNVAIDADANGWRMPSEYEWEFAAKGGRKSAGYTGTEADTYFIYSGSNDMDEVAWYYENSNDRTHEVGGKKANELGLYDMSGNVYEWCFDKFAPNREIRVVRGGSWDGKAVYVRSANAFHPRDQRDIIGFRLVRS